MLYKINNKINKSLCSLTLVIVTQMMYNNNIRLRHTNNTEDKNMKFFNECKTAEELKTLYKKLARKNHPDLGGDLETMKKINAEYDEMYERLKNIHEAADGKTYEKATTETPEQFRNIIDNLVIYDVTIDLVGSWIWVTGNTYTAKEILKELGFKWASKKKAWYWHADEDGVRRKSKMTLDEIKEKYGCESFKGKKAILIQ